MIHENGTSTRRCNSSPGPGILIYLCEWPCICWLKCHVHMCVRMLYTYIHIYIFRYLRRRLFLVTKHGCSKRPTVAVDLFGGWNKRTPNHQLIIALGQNSCQNWRKELSTGIGQKSEILSHTWTCVPCGAFQKLG